ncbi:PucR family transcriptional regulator ligand-binding domain-containing protein [Salinibacterium sp. NSLL150]|uniref:PucR family transcriptional regulator n=1 Tax=unclassified Salinibacterium TaxID=2632331 RepID=UPI0018CEA98A|nr:MULTISPECIES: PucR family transcriptional regulator [unclassified Salinibacterium]MBH0097931.1 PucR family transcriptional regulator ligand-binding domain-containing protein [Salinibacterium sp. NSLL35]MBH0100686.1 PucR family transcriptional regulator ligand-binding domain-containing protein [Salinibacterium sp. NSLL150]MBH0103445.1 PucR family transcriptional regulator ligand-binding domain-containing protein [Salinibacterium sp. NSLL16]MBH0106206.1 PucR family transcriptional regulator li
MPTPLADVIATERLALRPLTAADTFERTVTWVHNSDLDDPTPFVTEGQLLLTTGRQFVDNAAPDAEPDFDSYVARLTSAGVAAIGFGTEVITHGVPAGLVAACSAAGLPLFEVPYRIPFIAISRLVADNEAEQARAGFDRALAAQNDIASAAVGKGRLPAAAARAAEHLDCGVWIFDADGELVSDSSEPQRGGPSGRGVAGRASASRPADAAPAIRSSVTTLLGRARRARVVEQLPGEYRVVQTLGPSGRLCGAIAWSRDTEFGALDNSVMTVLAALAEVSLEQTENLRVGHRAILEQLFQLLKDGRVDSVRRAVRVAGIELPAERFAVAALELSQTTASVRDVLERWAARAESTFFAVADGRHLLVLIDASQLRAEKRFFAANELTVGLSAVLGWSELNVAITQAVRSLEAAPAGTITEFDSLVGESFFGLLASSSVADIAHARLASVIESADGLALLRAAQVWLRHNGQWDPAARELGIHRHGLKSRMQRLADLTNLSLDTFQGRAELWAMLAAIDLGETGS